MQKVGVTAPKNHFLTYAKILARTVPKSLPPNVCKTHYENVVVVRQPKKPLAKPLLKLLWLSL